jgi:hypothetical protein
MTVTVTDAAPGTRVPMRYARQLAPGRARSSSAPRRLCAIIVMEHACVRAEPTGLAADMIARSVASNDSASCVRGLRPRRGQHAGLSA